MNLTEDRIREIFREEAGKVVQAAIDIFDSSITEALTGVGFPGLFARDGEEV
ncbi:hypothetical protein SEA_SQUINT_178 [Mycobacterium phage Squint]|nr:hypothetical protein SEA_SQUINT_178 [Mycobacterium phage Squint]